MFDDTCIRLAFQYNSTTLRIDRDNITLCMLALADARLKLQLKETSSPTEERDISVEYSRPIYARKISACALQWVYRTSRYT